MKTINDQWKEFEAAVISPAAPKMQRVDMKRAFFAGFACGIKSSLEASELPSGKETQEAVASFIKQIYGFNEAVAMGGRNMWLSLKQEQRYTVLHHFRYAMSRAMFEPFLHKTRNVRRLWKWAIATMLHNWPH